MKLNAEQVLRNYFHAKDENRPHLLADVFAPDAKLQVLNRVSTIAFPAQTEGRDAIADVFVREFCRTNENVYSFYLDRPAPAVATFSCDWLVAMSGKDDRCVRVGCGRYDWAFDASASGLATGLVITIEAMQVLQPSANECVFEWVRRLTYPWSSAAAIEESSPPVELLAPVLRHLGSHAASGSA